MKVKTVTTYEFELGDVEAIKTKGPDDPCPKCSLRNAGCCGCPAGTNYANFINRLKNRSIYELWQKYQRFVEVSSQINQLEDEQDRLFSELVDAHVIDGDDYK